MPRYESYPPIRGVEPKLMKEVWPRDLPEYPDHETYQCRGIYEFDDHGITVTIKPHVPNETIKQWRGDPDWDPASVDEPHGWKIAVADATNALANAEGDTLYDSPGEAIRAVQNADGRALQSLQEAFDQ